MSVHGITTAMVSSGGGFRSIVVVSSWASPKVEKDSPPAMAIIHAANKIVKTAVTLLDCVSIHKSLSFTTAAGKNIFYLIQPDCLKFTAESVAFHTRPLNASDDGLGDIGQMIADFLDIIHQVDINKPRFG